MKKSKIKIGILGSRGIPNKYGGFEQFAEYLSKYLSNENFEVIVFNPHFHYPEIKNIQKTKIIHKWCPESFLGSAAHFIYDFLCLRSALKNNFDIIFELGYGTSAISYFLLNKKKSILVTNMDGLEWKRDKWNSFTKKFMRWSEKIAVEKSDYLIADNNGIKEYLKKEYGIDSLMIPYGSEIFTNQNIKFLKNYNVEKDNYFLLIARLEPENNIEIILDGYSSSKSSQPFLVVGNYKTKYGLFLKNKYIDQNIKFLNGIYDKDIINNLRYFSKIYFHGHSVGGTNPSLLEAMGCKSFIAAHDNIFNRNVLGNDSLYFNTAEDVQLIINKDYKSNTKDLFIRNNINKILSTYSWKQISKQHVDFFAAIKKK